MRVIFVNRFYWPDEPATAQLLADLCEGLAARGHSVAVVASHPGGCVPDTEVRAGVSIHRIRSPRIGRRSLAARSAAFAGFILGARREVRRLAAPDDAVVALTDPPLLGVPVQRAAARTGARCLHWVQDIFPEVAAALARNPVSRQLALAAKPLRDRAWREAAGCILPGHDMAAVVAAAGVPRERITVIPNWAVEQGQRRMGGAACPQAAGVHDARGEDAIPHSTPLPAAWGQAAPPSAALRAEWGLQDKFVVAYSGNMGRVHDLAPLIALARAVRDDSRIAFVFIGDGAQLAALTAAAARESPGNVQFRPPQPRARLGDALALADLHCVALRADCASLVFPSKLAGIAAAGRPALFVGPPDSEAGRLAPAAGWGFSFPPDRMADAAAVVRRLAANPRECAALNAAAKAFSVRQGGAAAAVADWERILKFGGFGAVRKEESE